MADERDDFMRAYLAGTPRERIEYLTEKHGAPVARAMRRAYGEVTSTWMIRRDRLPKPLIVNNEFHDTGSHLTFLLTAQGLPPVEVLYLSAWTSSNYGHNDQKRRRGFNPGVLGVNRWQDTTGTVAGESGPTNGRFSVADPRPAYRGDYGQLGVVQWQDTSHTVGGQTTPGQGWYSVADPRPAGEFRGGKYRVNGYDEPAGTVIAASTTGNGAFSVADPRPGSANGPKFRNCFRVIAWDHTSQAVTGGASPSAGGLAVQDPRWHAAGGERATYQTAGQYGVVPWDGTSRAVTGAEQVHKAAIAVADPRTGWGEGAHTSKLAVQPYDAPARTVTGSDRVASGAPCVADPRLPEPGEQLVAVIQALDGTWHRPFTTFELAALQGLVNPHEHLELAGLSDADWRERIGNAVPPPAAQAIASVMGSVLLRAWSGEGFMLSAEPIWVQPILAAYGAAT